MIAHFNRLRQAQIPVTSSIGYHLNDAATPIPNEADAIVFSTVDGWGYFSDEGTQVTITSNSTEFQGGGAAGLRSVEIKSTSPSGNAIVKLWTTIEDTKSYEFSFWAKSNVHNVTKMRGSSGFSGFPTETLITTTWTKYTYSVTATSTQGSIWFWAVSGDGDINSIFLDNITLIEV